MSNKANDTFYEHQEECKQTSQVCIHSGKDVNKKWEKDFDKRFPPFRGVGALWPIFKETPNREHIKNFIRQTREQARQEGIEMAIGALNMKYRLCRGDHEFYNQAVGELRAKISELKKK